MEKICHLTSVHPPFDIRIFYKECKTLVQEGYEVVLVVQQHKDEVVEGIQIRALPKTNNRLIRMTRIMWKAYQAAIKENAALYQFHDPELIPVGLLLKVQGKRVIYDVHEDVPRQILDKHWIYPRLRATVAKIITFVEWTGIQFFDGIVAATNIIARRFPKSKTIAVQNFPILDELVLDSSTPYQERPKYLAYVGAISVLRGIKEMVQAVGYLPESLSAQLWLAGNFIPSSLEWEVKALPGWDRVHFLGWQSRKDVAAMLGQARLGLIVLHSAPNHINAQPIKLFEYMSVGIPVIASDFPLWREVIEKVGCGLLVNPLDTKAIAEAIQWLLEHPIEAEAMGRRGQKAIREYYNWEGEAKKLLTFCKNILQRI